MADALNLDTEKLAFLFLGWLLGLLGPAVVEAIKRGRENALGQVAISNELRDLAHKLALATYAIHIRNGTLTRSLLEALKQHLESYAALDNTENILKLVCTQLSASDEDIDKAAQAMYVAEGKTIVLQKYPVPLLDSRVSALWCFNTEVQRRLLDLRIQLELLNDLVDRSRKFHDMTFLKLEGNNHEIVRKSIEECILMYANGATRIVSKITELDRLLPNGSWAQRVLNVFR